MQLSDRITGSALAALGAAAFFYGSKLPPVPGQQVGPSAFPMVVGAGLVICGSLIVFGIGRHFEEVAEADVASHATPEELAPVPAWRNWLALLPPALLAFYALASETLGFLPTTAIMVLLCSLAFGAKPKLAVPLAIIAPFAINLIFLKLLRVPLPGGMLPFPGERGLTMDTVIKAFGLVFQFDVMIAIVASAFYGLTVGALPGLSATMATALLVPVTFYLSPIAAIATIITASAMAIFSGDIPGCLLRIPGTPASAAYTDEAYAMTRKGQAETALGICLWFSALGGIAGTLSLMLIAPLLAEMALSFSTYENFWLAMLGLMCSTLVARSSPIKAIAAMLLGLLITCIGIDNPGGVPRFTFGSTNLLGGIEVIPALVGVFALAEVMRSLTERDPPKIENRKLGSILKGQWKLTKEYPKQQTRGNIVGIIIGVLPGAGADMAAWVSYAMSKRFSKTPEKFGTGHPEGLIEAGASNNASLASGWVPALLFGIPGDTITAIAIGVLYMKGLNPGPTLFTTQAESMYALYIIFILGNIIMIPFGIIMIRLASKVVGAPRSAVMPVIMIFCAVGAFATAGNNLFAVWCVAFFGVFGFVMEKNGYPVAAMVLGIVMGTMVEQNFVTSLIKSDGSVLPFFDRPVSSVLAAMTFAALLWPVFAWTRDWLKGRRRVVAA